MSSSGGGSGDEEEYEEPQRTQQRNGLGSIKGGRGEGFVEFEDEEEAGEPKALTGRRLKRKKEMQKKMKTGTFGAWAAAVGRGGVPCA